MTTKRLLFATMCVMLLTTVVIAGMVGQRVAPILQIWTGVPKGTEAPVTTEESVIESSIITETTEAPTETTAPRPTVPDHDHEFSRLMRSKPATCEEIGYNLYVCNCGATDYRDFQDKLGHNWSAPEIREATCTQQGGTVISCSNCGQENVSNVQPMLEHSYGDWEADPEDPTKEIRSCATCTATESRDAEDTNDPTGTTGANDPTETTGANDPTETTGANDPTETTGANDPTETTGANDPTETTGVNDPTETTGSNET